MSESRTIALQVTPRELATIRAALVCWSGSFDQARDELESGEHTFAEEWDLATGGRCFRPLDADEIGDLAGTLGF